MWGRSCYGFGDAEPLGDGGGVLGGVVAGIPAACCAAWYAFTASSSVCNAWPCLTKSPACCAARRSAIACAILFAASVSALDVGGVVDGGWVPGGGFVVVGGAWPVACLTRLSMQACNVFSYATNLP